MWSLLLFCLTLHAQQAPMVASAARTTPKTAYYIDPIVLDTALLLPAPPAADSAETKAELAELHRIEQSGTPEQVAQANADAAEEDMFAFKTVFGPHFNPAELPLTAALGEHVKDEQSVVGGQLKRAFQRARPYQTDPNLHPVCPIKAAHDSYPSGHALTGYLEAFTLIEIVPERRTEILQRADEFAHNRLVCGVHYPTDIEASRRVAYAVFGYMLATPRFQHDLADAREEMRQKLRVVNGAAN
jgi:acid phosphatase (class A)